MEARQVSHLVVLQEEQLILEAVAEHWAQEIIRIGLPMPFRLVLEVRSM